MLRQVAVRCRRFPPCSSSPLSPSFSRILLRSFAARTCRIPRDVETLFQMNDEQRHSEASDSQLMTLDDLTELATSYPTYAFPIPTFASPDWSPNSGFQPTQEEYNNLFEAYYPRAMNVLRHVDNVVVAGGAAGAPFLGTQPVGDVDFFVHGLDPHDEKGLWAKAREVAEVLGLPASGTTAIAPGVITFRFVPKDDTQTMRDGVDESDVREDEDGRRKTNRVIQLVLRAYPSTSSLIHAFDVPSSAIAFDGQQTLTTALGGFAQVYKVNLVNLEYRSTTFEKRLQKYFRRGFALGFPNFDIDALSSNHQIDMPHLRINPLFSRGNYIATQSLHSKKVKGSTRISDYSPSNHSFVESLFNFSQIIRGSSTLIAKDTHPTLSPDHTLLGKQIPVTAAEVMQGKVLTKGDLLPRALFEECLKTVCDEASEKEIKPAFLRKYLALTPEAAKYFVERRIHMQVVVEEHFRQEKELSMKPTVAKLAKVLTKRYEAFKDDPVEWWIKSDPGRQWTASRNPLVSEPRLWYTPRYYIERDQKEAAQTAQMWFRSREVVQSRTGMSQEEDFENFVEPFKRPAEPGRKSRKVYEEEPSVSEADLIDETRTAKSSVEVDIDWSKFKGHVVEDVPPNYLCV